MKLKFQIYCPSKIKENLQDKFYKKLGQNKFNMVIKEKIFYSSILLMRVFFEGEECELKKKFKLI